MTPCQYRTQYRFPFSDLSWAGSLRMIWLAQLFQTRSDYVGPAFASLSSAFTVIQTCVLFSSSFFFFADCQLLVAYGRYGCMVTNESRLYLYCWLFETQKVYIRFCVRAKGNTERKQHRKTWPVSRQQSVHCNYPIDVLLPSNKVWKVNFWRKQCNWLCGSKSNVHGNILQFFYQSARCRVSVCISILTYFEKRRKRKKKNKA